MSCLLHSMQLDISSGFLFLKTAKEIWDAVAQTYSQVGNTAIIYELQLGIDQLKEGNM